jgi:hypothetical protein
MDWDLDYYDPTTGTIAAWIKNPSYTTSASPLVYMTYNDPSISTFQGNTNGTWDSSFVAVIHLNASGTQNDSTSNANNLNHNQGTVSFTNTNALFGYAFDNSGGGLHGLYNSSAVNTPSGAGAFSLSIFFKFPGSPNNSDNQMISMGQNAGTNVSCGIDAYKPTNVIGLGNSSTFVLGPWTADNNWHHVCIMCAASANASATNVYLDGTLLSITSSGGGTSSPYNLPSSSSYLCINCNAGNTGAGSVANAYLDEARFSSTQRSADWITNEAAQINPTSLYMVGSEGGSGAGSSLILDLGSGVHNHG